jgi:hypothetical protein
MSGGSSSGGSQTTTQALPGYAQPAAQQILSTGTDLANQQMPQYGGQLVAGLNGNQNAAINQVQQLNAQGNAALNGANQYVANATTNGGNAYAPQTNQYVGQNVQASQNQYATMDNPYLDQQVNKAQTDLTNQYNAGTAAQTMAQFRNAGAFGGSAMQQTQDQQNNQLANALTNVDTQLRGNAYASTQQAAGNQASLDTATNLANQSNNLNYTQLNNALNSQNYNAGQSNALSAASLAPNLNQANYYGAGQLMNAGTQQQTQNQNELNAQYQQWYNQAYSPYQQLGVLQSALSGALGNGAQGVTTSTQSGGSNTAALIGGGAALGGGLLKAFGS